MTSCNTQSVRQVQIKENGMPTGRQLHQKSFLERQQGLVKKRNRIQTEGRHSFP